MGSPVGAYTEKEVEKMSRESRTELKREVLKALHESSEIRDIIDQNPLLLTNISTIRDIVREKTRSAYERLKRG